MTRFFGLDIRSLALTRIILSLSILWDLFSRLLYSPEFLWGQALARPQVNLNHFHLDFIPSLHILNASLPYQGALFVLHTLLAISLLLGWRTPWVTPALWYMTLSLHFSHELILNGGDYLLRNLLFVGMFLPWGQALSLDAKREPNQAAVVANAATVLWFAQICLLYWSAAMLKTDPAWVGENTALYYALSLETFATPLGLQLSRYPDLLQFLTALVYWTEWIAPLLLLLGQPSLRILGIAVLSSLHLSIILSLSVGLFWLVPIAALLALLPTGFWRDFETQEVKPESKSDLPRVTQTALTLVALMLAYLNLATNRALRLPEPIALYTLTRTLGLHYGWGMFVRVENLEDGWLQGVATFTNQEQKDLLWALPLKPDRPKNWASHYSNQRWRRYLLNLRDDRFRDHRRPFLKYLKSRHEKGDNPVSITRLELWFWREPTLADYQDVEPQKRVLADFPVSASDE